MHGQAPGVVIRRMQSVDPAVDELVHEGYRSTHRYEAAKDETLERTTISLVLRPAEPPVEVRWPVSELDRDIWRRCASDGIALGAYDADGRLVAVCLAEKRQWHRTMWVWDLHVAAAYRGRGIGRQLVEEVVRIARREDCRAVALETQASNVPAITFYRRVGFEIEGIDLSYYSDEDAGGGGQVSLFMKRRL